MSFSPHFTTLEETKSAQEALFPQVRSPCQASPTQASKACRPAASGMEESQLGLLLPRRGPLIQSNGKPQASTGINTPPHWAPGLPPSHACLYANTMRKSIRESG